MSTFIPPTPAAKKSAEQHQEPSCYIQIDPQDYDEWRTTPPEEEILFQTPSKLGSPTTP